MIIDLTHQLSSRVPTWSGDQGFRLQTDLDYHECTTQTKFRVQRVCMQSGIGTHIDAPAHCYEGMLTVDQIPLDHLQLPCVVIDVSALCDEQYVISVKDVLEFESDHGKLQPGSCVLFVTGWQKYWDTPALYHNNLQFPSVSAEVAQLLVDRKCALMGIDTLSPDLPESDYPVHRILLGAGIYIVENVAHAQLLPATGARVVIAPLPIVGGTESPVRMFGIVE